MNKKINRRQTYMPDEHEENADEHSVRLLHTIHKKLDASPALNGGFDRLLYKIDGIEKSQGQIVEKVDKIHDAIYHPDDGLFARIASTKAAQVESVGRVEKQVEDLVNWKAQAEDADEDCEKEADELQLKLQHLQTSLENVEKFQSLTMAGLKWTLAAVAGGAITLLFKLLYNVVKVLP